MQSDVFYWVLNLSIHGSLVCLLLMLLRLIRTAPGSGAHQYATAPHPPHN